MNYSEDDLLMLSALQHLIFCERQCAFIHIEQLWIENKFTAEGRIMHNRVHKEDSESRGNIRTEFGVSLRSLRLGITGQADVVEFHHCKSESGKYWQPFPVEYKRGRPKKDNSDKVQLCAQAICLEEMLYIEIPCGALYYGKNRRRQDVEFTSDLRAETANTAKRLHELIDSGVTPKPVYSKKCENCSFEESCMPKSLEKVRSVKDYLTKTVF